MSDKVTWSVQSIDETEAHVVCRCGIVAVHISQDRWGFSLVKRINGDWVRVDNPLWPDLPAAMAAAEAICRGTPEQPSDTPPEFGPCEIEQLRIWQQTGAETLCFRAQQAVAYLLRLHDERERLRWLQAEDVTEEQRAKWMAELGVQGDFVRPQRAMIAAAVRVVTD